MSRVIPYNTFAFKCDQTDVTSYNLVHLSLLMTHLKSQIRYMQNVIHLYLYMDTHAPMLCCNSYESSMHFFQKQQALQRLCAESLNSCFSDVGQTVLSLLFCFFSLSLSAQAAESAHQINTERGIVFRLETAEQVMDNGSTWKCAKCEC